MKSSARRGPHETRDFPRVWGVRIKAYGFLRVFLTGRPERFRALASLQKLVEELYGPEFSSSKSTQRVPMSKISRQDATGRAGVTVNVKYMPVFACWNRVPNTHEHTCVPTYMHTYVHALGRSAGLSISTMVACREQACTSSKEEAVRPNSTAALASSHPACKGIALHEHSCLKDPRPPHTIEDYERPPRNSTSRSNKPWDLSGLRHISRKSARAREGSVSIQAYSRSPNVGNPAASIIKNKMLRESQHQLSLIRFPPF